MVENEELAGDFRILYRSSLFLVSYALLSNVILPNFFLLEKVLACNEAVAEAVSRFYGLQENKTFLV